VARKVVDPDGVRWKVWRQWMQPTTRRVSRGTGYDVTGNDVPTESELLMFSMSSSEDLRSATPAALWQLVPLAPIVALVVGLPFLIVYFMAGPVALAAVIALLIALAVVWVRRRTWTVRARALDRAYGHVWKVRGWRSSTELVDAAADALESGFALPEGGRRFGTRPEDLPPLWRG
jgi:hypothetical protein